MKTQPAHLGIDNVFFDVFDLESSLDFYTKLGFKQKLSLPQISTVLLSLSGEERGLILCERPTPVMGKMWVKTSNVSQRREVCRSLGILGKEIHSTQGVAFEISDSSGNVLCFANFSEKLEGGKKTCGKKIVREYACRAWNDRDLTAVEEFIHEKAVIHTLLGKFQGQHAMKKVIQSWFKGFPDLKVTNDEIVEENNLVIIHWHAKGTHLGEFKGRMPTGRKITFAGVGIYRIEKNKIVEYWTYLDMQHIFNQITC